MVYIVLVSLSILIMGVYLGLYSLYRGLPTSISNTFYVTEKQWLFPVILTIAVALCVVPLFDFTPEPYKVLAFGLIGGLLFVAAAPAFKQEFEGNVHKYSAIVAGICALLWLILMNGVPLLAIAGYIVSVIDRKRCVFWIEFGLLSNVYYVLAFFSILHI